MTQCWAELPAERPGFADILWMLTELKRLLVPQELLHADAAAGALAGIRLQASDSNEIEFASTPPAQGDVLLKPL